MVKILLTHPKIKTNIKNYENKNPKDCIAEHVKEIIEPEFIKIEKRNQILELATQKSNCAYTLLLTGALAVGLCFVVDNPVPLCWGTFKKVCQTEFLVQLNF